MSNKLTCDFCGQFTTVTCHVTNGFGDDKEICLTCRDELRWKNEEFKRMCQVFVTAFLALVEVRFLLDCEVRYFFWVFAIIPLIMVFLAFDKITADDLLRGMSDLDSAA